MSKPRVSPRERRHWRPVLLALGLGLGSGSSGSSPRGPDGQCLVKLSHWAWQWEEGFRNFKQVCWEGIFITNELGKISLKSKQNATPVTNVPGFMVLDLNEGEMLLWASLKVAHSFPPQHTHLYPQRLSGAWINPGAGWEGASVQPRRSVGLEEVIIFVTDIFSGCSFFLCPFQVFVFLCFHLWNLSFI